MLKLVSSEFVAIRRNRCGDFTVIATAPDKTNIGNSTELIDAIEDLGQRIGDAKLGIGRVIFGQENVVEETLITLLAGGHLLLVGVPGLGKTRLVETLVPSSAWPNVVSNSRRT